MKEEFDEQLLLWSKAICKKKCTTITVIQTLFNDVDTVECEFFV